MHIPFAWIIRHALAAGCSFFAITALAVALATPSGLEAQDPTFPALAADAPAGSGITQPCQVPGLHGTARCGVFRVLENRERTSGRTIDIAFVVLDALEPRARVDDAIILLPGGPGEAFTHTAARQSRALGDGLRRDRDILLVDVRGVGRSSALSCAVPYPGGFTSRFGTVFPLEHVAACRDELSSRAQLDQYTTAAMVDDLEELRRWLGYRAFNLFGGSYGTRVAQIYIRRHRSAVRTAVLNGVAPVAEPLYVQHAFLLQRALDRLLDECLADASCRSAHPDVKDRLARLLSRFESGPVELEVRGSRVSFGAGDLSYALRGLLYARGAEVPGFIHRGAEGDIAALAEYYVERTDQFSAVNGNAGLHFSVLCAEDIAPLTDAMVTSATRGTFMGAHLIDGYRSLCRIWPYAKLPASHWTPVRSDVPTLLLSGGRDPVTPPEGGDAVAAHLSRSLHVVIPNGGHGVGGECVRRLIDALVSTGMLEGLDPSCGGHTVLPRRNGDFAGTPGTPARRAIGEERSLPRAGLAIMETRSRWCAAFAGDSMRPGDAITLVLPDSASVPVSWKARLVGRRDQPCTSEFPQIGIAELPSYDVALVDTVGLGEARLPHAAIAVAGNAVWQRGSDGIARADLDGDGRPEEARVCRQDEGEHFTLWTYSSGGGERRRWFHQYFDLGAFVDENCAPEDIVFEPPPPETH